MKTRSMTRSTLPGQRARGLPAQVAQHPSSAELEPGYGAASKPKIQLARIKSLCTSVNTPAKARGLHPRVRSRAPTVEPTKPKRTNPHRMPGIDPVNRQHLPDCPLVRQVLGGYCRGRPKGVP
jgi:hypothetical protein